MIYTLICYRANGQDTCRGCEMGRSDSDFEAITSDNINNILALWLEKEEANERKEREYCSWEINFLINGISCSNQSSFSEFLYEEDDNRNDIVCSKYQEILALFKQKNLKRIENILLNKKLEEEKAAARAEKYKILAEAAKEAAEKSHYEELKLKFG